MNNVCSWFVSKFSFMSTAWFRIVSIRNRYDSRVPEPSALNGRAAEVFTQTDIEILAEEIISLVSWIQDKQHHSAAFEEASFALHFRQTKRKIARALNFLQYQGRARRSNLPGHWFFPTLGRIC
jgi:hypothetical protein